MEEEEEEGEERAEREMVSVPVEKAPDVQVKQVHPPAPQSSRTSPVFSSSTWRGREEEKE